MITLPRKFIERFIMVIKKMLKTNSEWYEVDNFFFLASGRAHSLLQKYDHEYVVYFETFVIFL